MIVYSIQCDGLLDYYIPCTVKTLLVITFLFVFVFFFFVFFFFSVRVIHFRDFSHMKFLLPNACIETDLNTRS